jgi:hypothetical protein
MYDLVLKDFRNNKRLFLSWLLWIPLWIGIDLLSGFTDSSTMWPLLACYLSVVMLFNGEESWKSNFLYASLPYTKRSLMTARYISVWIIMITASAFFIGADQAWMSYAHGSAAVKSFPSLLLDFSFGPVLMLLTIPLIIRFGSTSGLLLGVLAFACTALLVLVSSWLGLLGAAQDLLNSLAHSAQMKNVFLALFALLVLLLGTLLSYRISGRVFERMDLNR